ncbi:MAG: alpha/beta fold hydrolase [Candidatus Helarchaeota archaeon]
MNHEVPPKIPYKLKEIQIKNYVLTYWEEGIEFKGQRPTLYFLHGWMGDIQDWYWQFEYFASKYHVMAHHHRHHGTSTTRDEPVTIKDLADDFYQILLQKGISDFILIGHSMGTFVSLEFMLEHQGLVKGLILIGGASRLQLPLDAQKLIMSLDSMEQLAIMLNHWFNIPLRKRPKEMREFYKRLNDWEIERKKRLPMYIATRFAEAFKYYDVTMRLAEITTPTLIIYGEQDTMVNQRENSAILMTIPNSRLVIIKDSGHSPTREQIDKTNAVLEDFFRKF